MLYEVITDGVATPATYNPLTGTLTPNVPLADGIYDFTYTLTDAVGNESAQSDPLTIEIDTLAPATPDAPASYEDNVGPIQDPASTEPFTDDATPGINIGTGVTDTPTLYVDGVETPATYDPITGTLTPDSPVSDGTHDFTYTLTDTAGNESDPSAPLTITIDTVAPATAASVTIVLDANNDGFVNATEKGTETTTDVEIGIPADAQIRNNFV